MQYAIYFLLDSPASTFVVCDPLAPGLQYVPGSLSVSTGIGDPSFRRVGPCRLLVGASATPTVWWG